MRKIPIHKTNQNYTMIEERPKDDQLEIILLIDIRRDKKNQE